MKLTSLQAWYESGGMILLYIIVIFAVLGLAGYLIKKFVIDPSMKKNNTNNEPIDEKKVIEEELSRVLETVDDEQAASEISDYKEENDK